MMTKTRKTLILIFLLLAFSCVGLGSYARIEHWADSTCYRCMLGGICLVIASLVVAMWRPRLK
ncbi:hypothetical protein [uncultured Draconibacterium sp.]|uniref:hypothetical protein n=1 Tax=uncultured Draconibacterium sp. TaxID=1573823 RepID=UPI0025F2512B|nr:hypothetical protein [uncultured Draconibacterium sp.]